MKKKLKRGSSWQYGDLPKILRIMKLIGVFLFVALMQVSASSYSQTKELTVKGDHLTLEELFEMIEIQSEFSFMYNLKQIDLSKEMDVNIENQTVDEILNRVLKGTDITYTVNDRLIVIHKGKNVELTEKLAEGQQRSVSGKVTDSTGQPLPGVTVVVKGTTLGTVTDTNGRYSLADIPENASLQFSFVGMKTQELPIAERISINVIMEEDAIGIDEVVAIGYGTIKKSDLTGSVASVKSENLQNVKSGSVADALQGLATGVYVSKSSFKPGGSSNLLIRGVGSFGNGGASNKPLYVVDGIISNAGLDVIAPQDIESIEILKDASSTAIYGSRGSNGVVIITTKKGNHEKIQITLDTHLSLLQLANKQEVLNASQFREIIDKGTEGTYIWDEEENLMKEKGFSTDWQDEITQNGINQNYSLGIKGGGSLTNHYLGIEWLDQKGIILNTSYKRANLRYNMNSELKDWLRLSLKLNVIQAITNSSNTDGVAGQNSLDQGTMGSAIASKPTAPVYNQDGSYYDNLLLRPNPVAAVTYFTNNFKQNRIIGGLGFEVDLSTNLKFKTDNGGEIINNISNIFQDSRMTGIYKNVNVADRSNGQQVYLQSDNTLTYEVKDDVQSISGVGGFSISSFDWDYTGMQVLNASNITRGYSLGTGEPNTVNSDKVKSTLASFYGRLNYVLREKYLATVTFRADGSSKFAKGHKWGYFPSGSVAWRLSEENFLKNSEIINNLKLRVSYGAVGNQEINSYQSMAQVDATSSIYTNYVFGNDIAYGSRTSILAQPELTWEKSKQFDLGLDYGFIYNRVSGSIDIYQKKTDDLLYNVPLPVESGYRTALVNVGAIKNEGIEFVLNTVNISNENFSWQTTFNYSFNKNEIVSLYNDLDRVGSYFIGQPISVVYRKRFGGIWQEDEAKVASVYGLEPGDIKIVDKNRNNIIDDGDRTFVGQTMPQFFGSLLNTIKYKNLDCTIFFTYAGGHIIYNPFSYLDTYSPSANMSIDYFNNYWTSERPSNKYPRLGSVNSFLYETDGVYQKGDYVRLKNIELGYTLFNKLNLERVRFYISAQNLLTFTDYTGFDVEVSNANPYPASRAYIAGLSINF